MGYSAFPKSQHYWSLTIRLFIVISGHSLGGILPLGHIYSRAPADLAIPWDNQICGQILLSYSLIYHHYFMNVVNIFLRGVFVSFLPHGSSSMFVLFTLNSATHYVERSLSWWISFIDKWIVNNCTTSDFFSTYFLRNCWSSSILSFIKLKMYTQRLYAIQAKRFNNKGIKLEFFVSCSFNSSQPSDILVNFPLCK